MSRDFRITVALLLGFFVGFCAANIPLGFGRVEGDCMEPALRDGQWVLYVRHGTPRPGDILSAWLPSDAGGFERVVHRVQAVTSEGWVELRGDNGMHTERCRLGDVRGIVVWPRPKGESNG